MNAFDRLHAERATGQVAFRFGSRGVERLREAGSAKLRIPVRSNVAILINISGGLAGGDQVEIEAAASADLVLTSQAAERVYCSLGPPARVHVSLQVEGHASMAWLPHETIIFNGGKLERRMEVSLAEHATFTACEAVILGRMESGETVATARFRDHWLVRREGRLIHADIVGFGGSPPATAATLAGAKAFATILHVSPQADRHLERLRGLIRDAGGVSTWNGKLVARLVAMDGFTLRKTLKMVVQTLQGPEGLPKTWAM